MRPNRRGATCGEPLAGSRLRVPGLGRGACAGAAAGRAFRRVVASGALLRRVGEWLWAAIEADELGSGDATRVSDPTFHFSRPLGV